MAARAQERLVALAGGSSEPGGLRRLLHMAAKLRHAELYEHVLQATGGVVTGGPFKGMKFPDPPAEGCAVPKLMGSYEAPLHPAIEALKARPIAEVYDVGCAEGYYAVGLARIFPHARVRAFDINPKAREACAKLARLNGVEARVEVGGECDWQTLSFPDDAERLVFCDIEGAERELLDPSRATGLRHAHVIVECHDCFSPGLSAELARRFASTHDVSLLRDDLPGTATLGTAFNQLSQLDRLLSLWEWRAGATPWLVMMAKG